MNILLTNDDGIFAPGLRALHKHFAARHAVVVVAPDQERSAVGHGITLHTPLRSAKVAVDSAKQGFAVNGKPADCVKLGIYEILSQRPDLVIWPEDKITWTNAAALIAADAIYNLTPASALFSHQFWMTAGLSPFVDLQ